MPPNNLIDIRNYSGAELLPAWRGAVAVAHGKTDFYLSHCIDSMNVSAQMHDRMTRFLVGHKWPPELNYVGRLYGDEELWKAYNTANLANEALNELVALDSIFRGDFPEGRVPAKPFELGESQREKFGLNLGQEGPKGIRAFDALRKLNPEAKQRLFEVACATVGTHIQASESALCVVGIARARRLSTDQSGRIDEEGKKIYAARLVEWSGQFDEMRVGDSDLSFDRFNRGVLRFLVAQSDATAPETESFKYLETVFELTKGISYGMYDLKGRFDEIVDLETTRGNLVKQSASYSRLRESWSLDKKPEKKASSGKKIKDKDEIPELLKPVGILYSQEVIKNAATKEEVRRAVRLTRQLRFVARDTELPPKLAALELHADLLRDLEEEANYKKMFMQVGDLANGADAGIVEFEEDASLARAVDLLRAHWPLFSEAILASSTKVTKISLENVRRVLFPDKFRLKPEIYVPKFTGRELRQRRTLRADLIDLYDSAGRSDVRFLVPEAKHLVLGTSSGIDDYETPDAVRRTKTESEPRAPRYVIEPGRVALVHAILLAYEDYNPDFVADEGFEVDDSTYPYFNVEFEDPETGLMVTMAESPQINTGFYLHVIEKGRGSWKDPDKGLVGTRTEARKRRPYVTYIPHAKPDMIDHAAKIAAKMVEQNVGESTAQRLTDTLPGVIQDPTYAAA